MNSKFIPEYDQAIRPQNLGPLLMKSSQSNFNLRLPDSYSSRSYLIATVQVRKGQISTKEKIRFFENKLINRQQTMALSKSIKKLKEVKLTIRLSTDFR